MAIVQQITEPTKDDASVDDWYKIIARTTFQGGGFLKVMLRNLNTAGEPVIVKGSRLELNGAFFVALEDAPVDGLEETDDERWVFIYARFMPNDDPNQPGECVFEYGDEMPVYDESKCAWYNENHDRAIAKMYKRSDGLWGKVLLHDYENMFDENFTVLPDSGGTLTASGGINVGQNNATRIEVDTGVYLYDLKGGKGGRGGYQLWSGTPGQGAYGEEKKGHFIFRQKTLVEMSAGGDGDDGENGQGDSGGGDSESGGGGGASGGSSYIYVNGTIIIVEGGSGGGGCGADGTGSGGGGGGGGGGGYGIGGNGSNSRDGWGGAGGNNFIGGAGGRGDGSGENGVSGGSGYSGLSRSTYNRPGGTGGGRYTLPGHYFIGGAGGRGVKNTTSGRSKLFKLWDFIPRAV